jgi:hypothetical protein
MIVTPGVGMSTRGKGTAELMPMLCTPVTVSGHLIPTYGTRCGNSEVTKIR